MQEAFRNSKERKASDLEQSPISYVSLPDVLPERIGSPASFSTVVPVAAWIPKIRIVLKPNNSFFFSNCSDIYEG